MSFSPCAVAGKLKRFCAQQDCRNVQLSYTTGSALVAWTGVQQGPGLGLMTEAVARATPEIQDAWEGFEGVPVPMWLVTHRELRTAGRIRLVFDVPADLLAD